VSGLDATFAALADPTRRAVVDLLRREPLRAGELAEALDMSPPAMSRHLRVLRACGLVDEETPADDARVRVLRLRQAPFDELRHWIEEVEQFWTGQLASFKAHAERRTRGRPRSRRR
jgi:DNA-binding transcriptional ArsR family regulator